MELLHRLEVFAADGVGVGVRHLRGIELELGIAKFLNHCAELFAPFGEFLVQNVLNGHHIRLFAAVDVHLTQGKTPLPAFDIHVQPHRLAFELPDEHHVLGLDVRPFRIHEMFVHLDLVGYLFLQRFMPKTQFLELAFERCFVHRLHFLPPSVSGRDKSLANERPRTL